MSDFKRATPNSTAIEEKNMSAQERAAARAAELRSHGLESDASVDKFHVDASIIPDGWTYEWKRHTTFGQEDHTYAMQLLQRGWQPVPANRPGHEHMMPQGHTGHTITREGMILMELPEEIVEEYRHRSQRDARAQVLQKEAQLYETPAGTLPRDADSRVRPKLGRSYEAPPKPSMKVPG